MTLDKGISLEVPTRIKQKPSRFWSHCGGLTRWKNTLRTWEKINLIFISNRYRWSLDEVIVFLTTRR
jgi:hypothetical protein